MVYCPICSNPVKEADINEHIDSGCETYIVGPASPTVGDESHGSGNGNGSEAARKVTSFFRPQQQGLSISGDNAVGVKKEAKESDAVAYGAWEGNRNRNKQEDGTGDVVGGRPGGDERRHNDSGTDTGDGADASEGVQSFTRSQGYQKESERKHSITQADYPMMTVQTGQKRSAGPLSPTAQTDARNEPAIRSGGPEANLPEKPIRHPEENRTPPAKRAKPASALHRAQPLAERMRPRVLDEVLGQELLGPEGVLRNLILSDKVPSMILWGGAGTGKTTIARLMAQQTGARFVEINSTSTGVAEVKKLFSDARAELGGVSGRKTIIFCDEIHRFSRSQQDVFLGPVEAGIITLVGATTENPSFKVQPALLSRCRVFTLKKLDTSDIVRILSRAIDREGDTYGVDRGLVNEEMVRYLAAFADGDARTGLNLVELAMDLSSRPGASKDGIKASLTKTLVYDRAGDQHYDTISAFHKSVRGSDPHAALYYLARMIQSGEDALYIARRMVVIASEDVGIADNSMLTLATSTYAAAEKVGLPEARINLAHCAIALCLARKSTRAYRGLANATAKLEEPGLAGLPIPIHLRNAPTRLMKEMGFGKEYKYNPSYVDGKVRQDYLPEELKGVAFLEDEDFGSEIDEDLGDEG